MDLAGVDLNLLVSLDALLAECNVTKAAARLHTSQPALSAQLAKLRLLFNDQMLLPAESGRGMMAAHMEEGEIDLLIDAALQARYRTHQTGSRTGEIDPKRAVVLLRRERSIWNKIRSW